MAIGNGQNNIISIGDPSNKLSTDEINSLATPNQVTEESVAGGGGCAETGGCEDNPLPVEILYFTAVRMGQGVHLSWATTLEENFDYFSLERASSDGVQFHELARIFSETGFSNTKRAYEFFDEMPLSGYSYYRLKTTDFDGYTEYHKIISIRMEDIRKKIMVFPNPVHGSQFRIYFSGEKETGYNLVSFTGRTLQLGTLFPGVNEIQIRSPLDPGIYFIQLEDAVVSSPQKFLIR